MVGDTINLNPPVSDSSFIQHLMVDYLHLDSVQVEPVIQTGSATLDIITIVLIGLLGMSAVIRYFLPDRFATIFTLKSESQLQRLSLSNAQVPGSLILSLFWLNFILSMGIFIFLIFREFFEDKSAIFPDFMLLGNIIIMLILLYVYRATIIYGAATIFQTKQMMKEQVAVGRNIQFLTGVILLPAMLLIIYSEVDIILYITIGIIIFLQLLRMVKIAIIGKSSTIFSALHIILYLCTLEIVPILVLIRLIENGSGI